MANEITQDQLKKLLHYDTDTGLFTWLVSPTNSVKAGSIAGARTSQGYVQIRVLYKNYLAHRLAWLYVHGEWPMLDIDHIDNNKINNAIANLRVVTHQVNQQNRKTAFRNNSVGYLGVFKVNCKHTKPFRASIKLNGKKFHLGYYETPEEAHAAYLDAKRKLHGGYVCEHSE
jgi:hypothetical protein